jgi:mercuric ion transport protein
LNKYKKKFIASVVGTIVVALCCFTPMLVVTLGIIGLSAAVPYLDFVLFPSLGVLILLVIVSYFKWKS